ncbi:MFS transporter [Nocardia gipuzkoensis]|uniref:MFS transporter n=1 Tax=Nocardia gipuzkoensis TaxID=2749991 RepID=UPI001E639B5A|nr:MFS transporter [Nocardia gipuzkoensis]UGT71915.1 MFS transporter [Nocardia gipuzkoensis]
MARIALLLLLQDHSALWVSAFLFASLVPGVFLAPLLAPAVDRIESRRLLTTTLLAQAVVTLAMAAAGSLPVAVIVGLAFTAGCLSALNAPAMMLLAEQADEVAASNPARAYATLDAARMTGILAGPALGGAAVGLLGFSVTMILDAASSCVLVALIAVLGLRRMPPKTGAQRPTWWKQVAEAPVLLASDAVVRAAMASLAVAIVFTAIFTVAEVFYVRDTLSASPVMFGVATTAFVVGRLVTSSWIAGRIPPNRQARMLVVAGLLMGAGLAGAGASHSLAGAMIGFAAAGVANSLQVSAISVLISTHVPAEVKGRAFAAMGSFNSGATMLGTLLGAPVVSGVGPAGALVVAGVGTFAATALAAPILLRRHPKTADTQSESDTTALPQASNAEAV